MIVTRLRFTCDVRIACIHFEECNVTKIYGLVVKYEPRLLSSEGSEGSNPVASVFFMKKKICRI